MRCCRTWRVRRSVPGALAGGAPIELHDGERFQISIGNDVGGPGRVSTTFAGLATAVGPGDTLLLDDGRIVLRVEHAGARAVDTVVVDGGTLGEHKGINAPGVALPADGLTAKDIEDLQFGVRIGVDFIGLSFVRSAADLRAARAQLRSAGALTLPLVAKLERPEAVSQIDEILREADAVMVARGDLGLELPLEHVPRVQKDVTRRARALGIPVIVATQVLESMRTETRPTRAEVSDAAHAVDSGVDAIMLAGETAVGLHPVKAVPDAGRDHQGCRDDAARGRVFHRRLAHPGRARPRHLRGRGHARLPWRRRRHRRDHARRQDSTAAVGVQTADADLCGHRSAGDFTDSDARVGGGAGARRFERGCRRRGEPHWRDARLARAQCRLDRLSCS